MREFAKDNGCSPAALYRHFESLEYLIILGAVRFFIDYMAEYGQLIDSHDNPLESYFKGWQLFNRYAFERPDLYYRLLWGQYNTRLSEALEEYFELFPMAGSERDPAYFYTLVFTNDIIERDLLMLRRAVNKGMLSYDDAVYYSKSNTLIVKGMLEMYMGCDLEARKQGEQECNQLLLKNLEKAYVPAGNIPGM
ncbi:MAG TPA: hypothetical protein DF613_15180 [Lachnospiraceae bacterium]|nr:hypothetical protein [Lachnospiraceae bacterium]